MGKFLLLLGALPLVDLFVLFKLGKLVGGGTAIFYVLTVGLCGAWLMRRTGVRVVGAWRRAFAEGRPADEGAASGALQFLGCALLIMPGVISDVLGLSLFVPAVRQALAGRVNRSIRAAVERGTLHVAQAHAHPRAPSVPEPRPPHSVIDVEAEVIDSSEVDRKPKRLEQ